MKRAVLLVIAVGAAAGCSLANRIDTCDAPSDRDFQVNSTTSGDQLVDPGRSLARLANGLFVGVWISNSDVSTSQPNEIRAALFQADGTRVPACASGQGDIRISLANDQRFNRVAVGVGPTRESPVYFAWTSRDASDTSAFAKHAVTVRLMRQDLCTWNSPPWDQTLFTMTEVGEDASAPVVAVRDDGQEAMIAWVTAPPVGSTAFEVHTRPVGISTSPFGAILANGCNGADAACVVSAQASAGGLAISTLGDGYALAWGEARVDGVEGVRMLLESFDGEGRPNATGVAPHQFGDVLYAEAALAETSNGVVLVSSGRPRTGVMAPDDDDVFVERFDSLLYPLGQAVRVNDVRIGPQGVPAVAVLPADAVFIAWTSFGTGASPAAELWGRVLDGANRPMFTGLSCDKSQFRLSSAPGTFRSSACVVARGEDVVAIWSDQTPAPGTSNDGLGAGIQGRRFGLRHLVPTLGDPSPGLDPWVPDGGLPVETCMNISSVAAGPCGCDADCPGISNCLAESWSGYPSGFCSEPCDLMATPASGTVCKPVGTVIGVVRDACSASDVCRPGWVCDETAGLTYCHARCSSDAHCPATMTCDRYTGACGTASSASLAGLNGPCTLDEDCRSGYCFTPGGSTPSYCLNFCDLISPGCPEGGTCVRIFSNPDIALGQCYFDCIGGVGGTCAVGWTCSPQGQCIESP